MKRVALLLAGVFLVQTISCGMVSAEGGASIPLEVEPTTGNATFSFPIPVPAGRGGVQPNLVLLYNSSFRNGPYGVGWNLDLSSIQVSTKRGVPQYDSTDKYVIVQNGSPQELVLDTQEGFYRTATEGAFMKTEKLTDGWKVTDAGGTKYYFGQTNASRQFDSVASTHIFRWALDRVENLNGEYMTITYVKHDGELYPEKIEYTGNDGHGMTPHARVEFTLDTNNRPDETFHFRPGFRVKQTKRVNKIEVYAANNLQARYELNYTQSSRTGRSLLSSLTQTGSDGVTILPATTFSYREGEKGFELATNYVPADVGMFTGVYHMQSRVSDYGIRAMDVNVDGYMDFIQHFKQWNESEPTKHIYINNQENRFFESAELFLPPALPPFIHQDVDADRDMGIRFADLNGDSYPDIVRSIEFKDNSDDRRTYLYDPLINEWVLNPAWTMPNEMYFIYECDDQGITNFHKYADTILVDVDGDGYSDIVRASETISQHRTFINRIPYGEGWIEDANWQPWGQSGSGITFDLSDGAALTDLNGDSLPDLMANNGLYTLGINDGNSWQQESSSPWSDTLGYGNMLGGATQFADINGDGLTDMMISEGDPNSQTRVLINTGNGWQADDDWMMATADFRNGGTRMGDFNGDGMTDYVVKYNGIYNSMHLNKGSVPDLLTGIDNGRGGKTTIDFISSKPVENTYFTFHIQIVKEVTMEDGQGNLYTTEYDYSGGYFDPVKREMRGFDLVRITDAEGNFTDTRYLQDDYFKNRVQEQLVYDINEDLFARTYNIWDFEEIIPGVNFVFLEQQDKFVYDGDSEGRRTSQKFFYEETPQLGHLTKTEQLGEVDLGSGDDIGTDSRSTTTAYVKNTSGGNWLHGLPKEIVSYDHNDQLTRRKWLYYDNQGLDDAPVKGQLTKEKLDGDDGTGGGTFPETIFAYDVYGNLESTTDPKGSTSSITYDSAYHLFPLVKQNALLHQVSTEYYGINGVPLDDGQGLIGNWGQTKIQTDANGQQVKYVYDALGRMIKTVGPLDTVALPSLEKEYTQAPTYTMVKTKKRMAHGLAKTIDGVVFADGLGRVLQSKSISATPGQYIVSGQTEYDSRGLAVKKYVPFFSTEAFETLVAIDTGCDHASVEYDAMGRAVENTSPDGSKANVEYTDWKTTTIDENGHKQSSLFDAYGRLIIKEEYEGADGRFPSVYPQETYTLYATTQYKYNSQGDLTQTIDALNNTTTISYDRLGRKIAMDDPDMGQWTYGYDLNGNLSWQIDARSQRIDFEYDALNRLTRKTDGANLDVDYTYDETGVDYAKGRLTQVDYGMQDRTQFRYDRLGREIKSTKMITGENNTVERTYNALDQLEDVIYPDNSKVLYEYNDAGQIKSVIQEPFSSLPKVEKKIQLARRQSGWQKFAGGLAKVGGWIERNVLGVREACAQTTGTITREVWFIEGYYISSLTNHPDYPDSPHLTGEVSMMEGPVDWGWQYGTRIHGYIVPPQSGNYRFWVAGDDYSQLSLSSDDDPANKQIIASSSSWTGYHQWNKYSSQKSQSIYLTAGQAYYIEALHKEVSGGDHISVAWERPDAVFEVIPGQYLAPYGDVPEPPQVPDAPVLDSATAGDGAVDLSWQSVSGATGYKVHYGTSSQSYGTPIDVGNVTSYEVPGLTNGIEYFFVVTAYDGGEESDQSNELSATPNLAAPSAPVLDSATTGDGSVTLVWQTAAGATSYKVYHGTSAGSYDTTIPLGDVLTYEVSGLQNGTTYYFAVTALNAGEESSVSNERSATPEAPEPPVVGGAVTNTLTRDAWYNVPGTSVNNLINDPDFPDNPDFTEEVSIFEGEQDWGWNYGSRIYGYIIPPTSGDYIFKVSGDDKCRLNLSTDADPVNKQTIAEVPDWTGYRQFNKYGQQTSSAVSLIAGQSYFIEVLHNDGGGGDHVSVAWERPDAVFEVIPGDYLSTQPAGRQVIISDVEYNVYGQMTRVEYGSGAVIEYTYNSLNARLERVYAVSNSEVVQDLNYEYDAVGNIVNITDNVNSATQDFEYDHLNRLTSAVNPETYGTKVYDFNEIGNILLKDGVLYTYGENGAGPHAVTSLDNGTTFTYDDNGNMETKTQDSVLTEYGFDPENRLNTVRKGGNILSQYAYDGDGGRTKKTVYGTSTEVTQFVGALFEKTTARTTSHIFLGDRKIASVTNGETSFFFADHLGGTNVITDSAGVKLELIEYEPFGVRIRHEKYGSGEDVAWHYFTGQRLDEETELYFYNARYYDPSLGRFITADTIVPGASNPQSFNRYSYCHNNPVNRIDPTGHWSWGKFWKSFAGAVVGVAAAVLLGPAGFAVSGATMAGAVGGAVGGAITGGLTGGWQGAGMGMLMGGALGGLGGWGVSEFGKGFGYGMLAVGAGVAGATDNWDSFAGGLAGGMAGYAIGNRIASYHNDGISSKLPAGQKDPYNNKDWDVLGIGTSDPKAQAFADANGSAVFYTKSRGYLSDFVRAGMQKVFGNSLASRQFKGFMSGANGFNIAGHSEGTLTMAGAMKALAVDGVKLPDAKFSFNGPVIMESTANNLVNSLGAQMAPNGYDLNIGDPIGVFTTPNPVKASLYGVLGVSTLATFHGTKYYPNMN